MLLIVEQFIQLNVVTGILLGGYAVTLSIGVVMVMREVLDVV